MPDGIVASIGRYMITTILRGMILFMAGSAHPIIFMDFGIRVQVAK
jgi:hypothetical protein